MTDAKFKLEDILNKKKAPPQILDLAHIRIESEEEFRNVIEKIPDYKIKPERVRLFFHSRLSFIFDPVGVSSVKDSIHYFHLHLSVRNFQKLAKQIYN